MELLIPGLILVALMAYVSTRIKRAAARAFEAETITGDGFSLEKPDGFLVRIGTEGDLLFDAYSKDFGTGAAENVRAATAVVIASEERLKKAAKAEAARLISAETGDRFELGDAHGMLITGESVKDGHDLEVTAKILEQGSRTRVLRIEVLKEKAADLSAAIEKMLISFTAGQ
jgi:hypothetical protein